MQAGVNLSLRHMTGRVSMPKCNAKNSRAFASLNTFCLASKLSNVTPSQHLTSHRRQIHGPKAGQPGYNSYGASKRAIAHSAAWGEAEFGQLQKKAASRLHRFYVPQPLDPAARPPSLDNLLGSQSPSRAAPEAASSLTPATSPPGPARPASGSTVVLEGDEARHASRALRLQAGDRVELCDGLGGLAEGTITGTDKQRVWVTTDEPPEYAPWRGSRWVVAVACTTLKGGRADWLVEKLTEMGAFMMVPLVTERSQAGGKARFRTRGGGGSSSSSSASLPVSDDSDGSGDYQPGRLERVAIAATKQSLRPHALHLTPPIGLQELLPLVGRLSGAGAGTGEGPGAGGEGTASSARGEAAAGRAATGGRGRRKESSSGSDRIDGSSSGGASESKASTVRGAEVAAGTAGPGFSGGGSTGFSLVAVGGAPPLLEALRELRSPGAAGSSGSGAEATQGAEAEVTAPVRFLFVGPEGDFTPAELSALVEAGARPVGLGANRLRTETAAIALLSACIFSE